MHVSNRQLYLDLMKRCLTNTIYGDGSVHPADVRDHFVEEARIEGRDWPNIAHTMIGVKRLDNLQYCMEDVLRRGVPGDFIETGAWRGGACIFMRAILAAYDINDRNVYVADSFQGLPPPDEETYPEDAGDPHHTWQDLAVPLEEVQENFRRYGLLDDQVRFLAGWFRDTLPNAPIERLAILRLDGDMFESTIVALDALYPKLSPGGYLIVDDYEVAPGCKLAIDRFRETHDIQEEMQIADWSAVYWQKPY